MLPAANPAARADPAAVRVLATDMTAPLLLDLAAAYAETQTSVAVVPVLNAEDSVADALTAGEADLALTTLPEDGLFATPLGYTRLAVVVHPDNAVAGLSAAQVQALLAGEITDWAQVGGAPGQRRWWCRWLAARRRGCLTRW